MLLSFLIGAGVIALLLVAAYVVGYLEERFRPIDMPNLTVRPGTFHSDDVGMLVTLDGKQYAIFSVVSSAEVILREVGR